MIEIRDPCWRAAAGLGAVPRAAADTGVTSDRVSRTGRLELLAGY